MSSETINVTNHTTRVLRISFPNEEGRPGLLKLVLLPGESRVDLSVWKEKCATHPGVIAWMKKGSLRNRTGAHIPDRSMISTSRKTLAGDIPKVAPSNSAMPNIVTPPKPSAEAPAS
jgi:hypothetical protein